MSHHEIIRMIEELFRLGIDDETIGILLQEAVRK
jgi:hypothetical protein